MSRIGRLPIEIPKDVDVKIENSLVHVKGPKGEMQSAFSPDMAIKIEDGKVIIERPTDQPRHRALHGTTRALLNNMITGVSAGFVRTLEVVGVGYRAEMAGSDLVVHVGYSHPVKVEPPDGISFEVDTKAKQIKILGRDKQQVGQVAANIRFIRPPEPYKGAGIKYLEEIVRRKAGKAGKTGA